MALAGYSHHSSQAHPVQICQGKSFFRSKHSNGLPSHSKQRQSPCSALPGPARYDPMLFFYPPLSHCSPPEFTQLQPQGLLTDPLNLLGPRGPLSPQIAYGSLTSFISSPKRVTFAGRPSLAILSKIARTLPTPIHTPVLCFSSSSAFLLSTHIVHICLSCFPHWNVSSTRIGISLSVLFTVLSSA